MTIAVIPVQRLFFGSERRLGVREPIRADLPHCLPPGAMAPWENGANTTAQAAPSAGICGAFTAALPVVQTGGDHSL
jgi:hypothetical protein